MLQGTKQGGKCSPMMYITFHMNCIDGPIQELEDSGSGMVIRYERRLDIVLLPYSKNGLDNMLDICYKFFCKWRYFYNVNKCAVFVFNETVKPIQNRTFCIGSDVM